MTISSVCKKASACAAQLSYSFGHLSFLFQSANSQVSELLLKLKKDRSSLAVVLAPLWAYLKGWSTVYAVTSQRVMVISGGTSRSVKSYTPADIVSVEHRECPDGSGDVLIRTNAITNTRNSVSQITVGLFGVSNVKEAARQVMTLHTQRTAA